MSHLHRYYARNAANVWELEGRWLRASGTFRAPAAIQWIATSACDLTCIHCYSHAGRRGPQELDTAEALALVDALADLECGQLVIAGGEPLLRKDLDEVVAHAASRGLRWSLHTHGGWVRERAALFERHPPAMVAVSLDGPEAVHDRLRGRPGSFREALEAMAWLRTTACPMVVAGTTVNRDNADTLSDLAPIVAASGAHAWGLHLFAPEGRGAAHRALVPRPDQLRRVAGFARRARSFLPVDLDNEWGSAGELDPLYRDDPFLCGAGRFTAVIASNGDIMPCTTTDPAEAEGNVRTHDLRAVWTHGFARFRGGEDPHARPGRAGLATCADGADCWLQTRNDSSCRTHAFGVTPAIGPSLPDVLPPAPPRPRAHGALRWAAALALAGANPALAAPDPSPQAPADAAGDLRGVDVERWAAHQAVGDWQDAATAWRPLKDALVAGDPPPTASYPRTAEVLRAAGQQPVPALIAALDELEADHIYDAWVVGELFVRLPARDERALIPLLARLDRHAHLADALRLAQAEVGPIQYAPWRKKSASPSDYDALKIPPGLQPAAQTALPRARQTTWRAESGVALTITEGTARLHRAGTTTTLPTGSPVTLGRLDALTLDGAASHASFGVVLRGSDRVITGRWAARALDAEAQATLEARVQQALAGDLPALQSVAAALPLTQAAIRSAVAASPDAVGAPALRQVLDLFDR